MIVPIPYVQAGIGLLSATLSIPLILRKVPMNRIYGIRLQKAFVSEQNWYELNSYGGKLFLIFGSFVFGFSYLFRDYAPPPTNLWALVFLIVPLIAIVPVIIFINRLARRLPDR